MLINISDVWDEARKMHAKYVEDAIDDATVTSTHLRHLLDRKRDVIVNGEPAQLRQLIYFTDGLLSLCDEAEYKLFEDECATIFDYPGFRNKNKPGYKGWDAYKLCQKSPYILCPYCQQSFAFTVVGEDNKSFRPTLDHFYSQARYPYLALTLNNLVPCCHTCNSFLKGKVNFFHRQHLHPLEDQESIHFCFDEIEYLNIQKSDGMRYEVSLRSAVGEKARNSAKLFLLPERYAIHSAMLNTFIQNMQIYDEAKVEFLQNTFESPAFFTQRNILNFDIGNYQNELLGKVKKDLYEQLHGS
ncbi:hypothetical protein MJ904_21460 [Massilia sp. MB5]|uniref:HNH endonuclease n=1 Tax=Massilia sp. MB5 TaxID=2919578 RepID=UPI001F10B987|nr:hypothetical protein [Massilia sp. MB5]UMR29595.1 hypothetical protein MJ904_21460 [Massilia sp. MB5]